mmetsp:Transcript_41271/g.90026  ORF Transcript_41271/g.90026 Transcript_41271/m.90026 type:complete len:208 (-) Transcript_41271:798-1421(-)
MGNSSRLELQEGDGTSQLHRLLVVRQLGHLVGKVLVPRLNGFEFGNAPGKFVPDDWLLNQPLPERSALVRPLHALLNDTPGSSNGVCDDEPPLMIEVVHDAQEATVLESDDILLWYLDILKSHVSSASRLGVAGLNRFCLEAFRTFDEHHGHTTSSFATCPDCCHKIVCCVTAGDPLLCAVNNVVLTIWALLSASEHICDVGPSCWL